MRVCHCHGITDHTIRTCVQQGATTTENVGRSCGAGTSCGGCRPLIDKLVQRETQRFVASNEAAPATLPVLVAG